MDPLEFLAQCNGCLISDLRYHGANRHNLAPLLMRNAEDFTVAGWNALLQYILPGVPQMMTQAEAHAYLEAHWESGITDRQDDSDQ